MIQTFEACSSQKINMEKFAVYLSSSITDARILAIESALHIRSQSLPLTYLGIPISKGRPTLQMFDNIKEKFKKNYTVGRANFFLMEVSSCWLNIPSTLLLTINLQSWNPLLGLYISFNLGFFISFGMQEPKRSMLGSVLIKLLDLLTSLALLLTLSWTLSMACIWSSLGST